MLGYCTCGSSAVGYPGPFLTHLTVQDGVHVSVLYLWGGSSAVGYLGPFLTHLTVQDGVDVRVLYLWELCCWVSWSIPHTSDSAGWCGC